MNKESRQQGGGGNPADAFAELDRLLAAHPHLAALLTGILQRRADPKDEVTAAQVITWYLKDAAGELSRARLVSVTTALKALARHLGDRRLADCTPLDLKHWIRDNARLKSPHTRHAVNAMCQRPFNWAVKMRLAKQNPFHGISFRKGDPQREMTEDEYRMLLRNAPAHFRRVLFFLRFTGCRPSELRHLRWENVDFEAGVARLREHKTRNTQRERKDRLIPLVPLVLKLLRWMRRTRKDNPVAVIRRLLAGGPVRAAQFIRQAHREGVPPHAFYRLARKAGARCRKAGPVGPGGFWVWELDPPKLVRRPGRDGYYTHVWHRGQRLLTKLADDREEAERLLASLPGGEGTRTPENDFVFQNDDREPWKKEALSNQMQRIKRRAGLPPSVRLYQLRHHFATELCRADVNLKIVAECLGHTTLTMASWYCHVAGDAELLRGAVERALLLRAAQQAGQKKE